MTSTDIRPPHEPLVASGQIDHHFGDMTVTASAELTLEHLQKALAERDQWLPIDGDPQSRLSTLIESNSTGPLRLGYGAWRDLLLGVQITTERDPLITVGGRTMKNVAGYDVTKFMVGQYGLFGRLVTITTRTYKRPSSALLVGLEYSDGLVNKLLPTPARPQWMMLSQGACCCGYLGDERTINFHAANMKAFGPINMKRQSLDEDIAFRAANWLPPRAPLRFRASVPPARLSQLINNAHLREFAADPVFGIVVGSYPAHQKGVLCNAVHDMDGRIGFDEQADQMQFSGASGAEQELLKRLQSVFNG